ncbi:MAG TPA: DNA/RNA helicase domain-containing protein [Verrucomicrobiae bacterium]
MKPGWRREDAAPEFQVQGLGLDLVCVTWDADLRCNSSGWSYHDFHGPRKQKRSTVPRSGFGNNTA